MLTQDVALEAAVLPLPGRGALYRSSSMLLKWRKKKGARRITAGHKANIMKLTDGLFPLECFQGKSP